MEYLPIILSALAVLAVYYYYARNRNCFKKHGVPSIEPYPIVGNMGGMVFRTTSLSDVIGKLYNLNPDAKYVGFYEFNTPIVIIRDIDLIKSVCVKHFDNFHDHRPFIDKEMDKILAGMLFCLTGEKWRDDRNMLSPAFTSSKIKTMFALMSDRAVYFAKFLSNLPEKERVLEVKSVFTRYTTDVIASCVFGIEVDSINDPKNPIYVKSRKVLNFAGLIQSIKILMARNMSGLSRMLGISVMSKSISTFFENLISTAVKHRDENGIYKPDMLQLLMETRNKKQYGKGFSIEDITTHAFAFFFGGSDTVASQLSFAIYHLATNPDVYERLQNEIDETLERTQGQLSYDAVMGMEYLDAVINETMRIHPIGAMLDRMSGNDFELPPALPGGKPFTVKAGSNIWIPVHAIHLDPNYYEDPHKFDPERFLVDGKRIMASGTYLPFGVGQRMCIGNRFALVEMKVLLCHLLARCDVKACSKTSVPLELAKGVMVVTAKNGFWVKIEPRKNPPLLVHATVANGTCKATN
ncbi:cytochrome P450 9e2-like [Colletes gigas]|uniref:cytochrome P450 9e2-like n=1 Tax=Colletes gigas TaxID=935657 RepID=UPI001C9B804A|nr:cytochrome P450 9e2-like [Colletes gigas]